MEAMSAPSPALAGYPRALLELVGEAAGASRVETRATCQACPMRPTEGEPPPGPRSFSALTCCTYHPQLPSFLLGRALRHGGEGAERVRARLRSPQGRHRLGVDPPPAFHRSYARDEAFGCDPSLRCPYLAETEGCAIYASRGGVCRTWYCRYDQGQRGREVWEALGALLLRAEVLLAQLCARRLGAPWPTARPEAWEVHLLRCADVVDTLKTEDLAPLRGALVGPRIGLEIALSRRHQSLPTELRTAPHGVEPTQRGVWQVVGYSQWDPVAAPPEVMHLLRLLREGGPWAEAARAARVEPALVQALWRAEVLVDHRA